MDQATIQRTEIQKAVTRGLKSLATAPPMTLSEWASDHFYLSAESSYVEQRWSAYPYQRAILDAMSNDDIREVVFKKSARVGYTKMIMAAMGYFAHHRRRNQCVWQPTDDDAAEFVKTEIEPMLRDVEVMREVFPSYMQRSKHNTLRQKVFLGSTLHIRGGKAAKNYRRLSVDVGYLDEADGFDRDIEKEGSPGLLAAKRVEGATFPKMIFGSTPKLKGFSLIESRHNETAKQFEFYVPCPNCQVEHVIRWGGKSVPHGFKFDLDDPAGVVHHCPTCGVGYTQAEYLNVWELGRWKSKDGTWIDHAGRFRAPDGTRIAAPPSVGFSIWTAYSPQVGWDKLVGEFKGAKEKAKTGDTSELKTFVNTTLGETWEEDVEETDVDLLKKRAEPYALRTVPMGGLILGAGVDTQDDRFEITVWAFGRGEEMWIVDYTVLSANPAQRESWDKLDAYLQTRYLHAAGQMLSIEAVAIDSQGHHTHSVYAFCRDRAYRRIYAIRGDPAAGKPIKGKPSKQDVNENGKVQKRGVKLWHVGTDTAKDLIHNRLALTQPGPGYMHFSDQLEDAFYDQLTAEVRIVQRTKSGEESRWIKRKPGARNEVLDCTVYSLFAAHALDLHRFTDAMWQVLADRVAPLQSDFFSAGAMPTERVEDDAADDGAPVQPQAAAAAPSKPAPRNYDNGGSDWIPDRENWL
ncbi:phage terminase large subunit family protein [Chitinasiproducens palmae]|uniref:Phage terminase, large subunit GpA n=1 Tax=Chitinasiproducens palmae TaxID=1770053 RepID=A0A1H2PPL4_9BURK|nr:phage terminase large subunit family protein [Chitinasiproducens palmae]SDV48697.1 Phage terminase, large subunit GpA [Chitinasiproducens palmae]